MSTHKMPPAENNPRPLFGPQIESFTVGSWCPTPDGSGKPTAVAISFEISGFGDLVMRIKSPQEVDRIIQMLLRHKRDVWPDSK